MSDTFSCLQQVWVNLTSGLTRVRTDLNAHRVLSRYIQIIHQRDPHINNES